MASYEDEIAEAIEISPFGGGPTSDNIEYPAWGATVTDGVEMDDPTLSYYYQITRDILEQLQFREAMAISWDLNTTARDKIGLSVAFLQLYLSATLTEGVEIDQSFALYKYAERALEDGVELDDTLAHGLKLSAALVQAIRIRQRQRIADHVSLSDDITMDDVARLYQYYVITERLLIGSTVSMPGKVYGTIAEQMELADNLSRFLGASLTDTLAVVETLIRRRRITPTLSEAVGVGDTVVRGLLLRVTASDALEIGHTDALKMLFKPTLADAIEIVSAYLDPEGLTTWAVNLSHGGVSEYTNYRFNSFAKMNGKYIGASDEGLFELNGDDDAGEDIIARIKSGMLQFGRSNYSSFKGIYLGVRGGGDYVLKLVTGDDKSYTYSVEARTMETTKVNVGKGLRARYFSFELISTGQDFDLDSIEFIPLVAKRRV